MKRGSDRYTAIWNYRKMQISCQFIWQSRAKCTVFREKTYMYQVMDVATWLTWTLPQFPLSSSLHSRNYISHVPLQLGLSMWPGSRQAPAPRQDSRGESERMGGVSAVGGVGGTKAMGQWTACAETNSCGKGIGFHWAAVAELVPSGGWWRQEILLG